MFHFYCSCKITLPSLVSSNLVFINCSGSTLFYHHRRFHPVKPQYVHADIVIKYFLRFLYFLLNLLFPHALLLYSSKPVRCQMKVHNCKCSYLCCNIILLFSEILLSIEFCFIISLIFLIFSPWPKYTSLGVRLSNDS